MTRRLLNAICADHNDIDLSCSHEVTCCIVDNQREWNFTLPKLPRCQTRALEPWAGFINQNVYVFALFVSCADHAEGCAVVDCRQRTRVTVVENGVAVTNERRAVIAQGFVDCDILVSQFLGFLKKCCGNVIRGFGRGFRTA